MTKRQALNHADCTLTVKTEGRVWPLSWQTCGALRGSVVAVRCCGDGGCSGNVAVGVVAEDVIAVVVGTEISAARMCGNRAGVLAGVVMMVRPTAVIATIVVAVAVAVVVVVKGVGVVVVPSWCRQSVLQSFPYQSWSAIASVPVKTEAFLAVSKTPCDDAHLTI